MYFSGFSCYTGLVEFCTEIQKFSASECCLVVLNDMVKQAGLIGLSRLVEDLGLRVPLPAVRSEAVQGARRTKISGASILEQYPLSYAPTDLFGQLRLDRKST